MQMRSLWIFRTPLHSKKNHYSPTDLKPPFIWPQQLPTASPPRTHGRPCRKTDDLSLPLGSRRSHLKSQWRRLACLRVMGGPRHRHACSVEAARSEKKDKPHVLISEARKQFYQAVEQNKKAEWFVFSLADITTRWWSSCMKNCQMNRKNHLP